MSIAPTPDSSRSQNTPAAAPTVPQHWTPEQALAAFECLQAIRQALCATYGTQVQQARREQLVPDGPPPDFDPDKPFVTGAHHQPLRHRHRQNPQGPCLLMQQPSADAASTKSLPRQRIEADLHRR